MPNIENNYWKSLPQNDLFDKIKNSIDKETFENKYMGNFKDHKTKTIKWIRLYSLKDIQYKQVMATDTKSVMFGFLDFDSNNNIYCWNDGGERLDNITHYCMVENIPLPDGVYDILIKYYLYEVYTNKNIYYVSIEFADFTYYERIREGFVQIHNSDPLLFIDQVIEYCKINYPKRVNKDTIFKRIEVENLNDL